MGYGPNGPRYRSKRRDSVLEKARTDEEERERLLVDVRIQYLE
jgi:hypothetical protein